MNARTGLVLLLFAGALAATFFWVLTEDRAHNPTSGTRAGETL